MSREVVLKLSEEKEKIEKEIKDLVDYLCGPDMPGIKGSLTDSEGFPLAGVDLYRIRQSRQRYNILNNDYTAVMQKIESEIHAYFGSPDTFASKNISEQPIRLEVGLNDNPIPFAEISEVTELSPAYNAGLRIGDKIIAFGLVNYANHDALNGLSRFVRESEGKRVKIKVLKPLDNSLVDLVVTPMRWEGTGILGCRFKPLN